MTGVKISNLPPITSADLTNFFPVVQGGATYKETVQQLLTLFNSNIQITESQVTNLTTDLAAKLNLSGGTLTGELFLVNSTPSTDLAAASRGYVLATAQGRVYKDPCSAASTVSLTVNYNNGSSGIGATLTNAGAMAAFVIDGYSASVNDRILIKNQSSTFQNGIYVVTTVGSGAANWVLTRATDMDLATEFKGGTTFLVGGSTQAGQTWTENAAVVTVGTDAVTFILTGDSTGITSINTAGLATGGPITSTGTITVTAAVQADQEAGTSNTTAVTPAVQQFHESAVKAHVFWRYVTGTPTIESSYNVTSLTDVGTGVIGVNFTVPFHISNYTTVGMGEASTSRPSRSSGSNTTTGQIDIYQYNSVTLTDDDGGVAFMGDQ